MTRPIRDEIAKLVREVALSQHGLITRSQAIEAGLSPRAIDRRLSTFQWIRIHPGVYCATAAASPYLELKAACLWVGDHAVVSHRSAANLWGLLGFETPIVEITTNRPERLPRLK